MTTRTSFSDTASRRAPRVVAAGLLGLAATLSLSACQWTSPITTQLHYDASDGKSVELGSVKVLNALIVAEKQDGPGTLVASFANQGDTKQTVQVKVGTQTAGSVEVPPGQVVQASSGGKMMQIAKVTAAPGAMVDVMFSTSGGDAAPVALPVLPPNPPYASLKPGGAASSGAATPSGSPSSAPTTTPAASATTAAH